MEGAREERPTDGRSEGRSAVELKNAPGQGRGVLGEQRPGRRGGVYSGRWGRAGGLRSPEAPRRGPRWRPREEPLRRFPDLPRPRWPAPSHSGLRLCPPAAPARPPSRSSRSRWTQAALPAPQRPQQALGLPEVGAAGPRPCAHVHPSPKGPELSCKPFGGQTQRAAPFCPSDPSPWLGALGPGLQTPLSLLRPTLSRLPRCCL